VRRLTVSKADHCRLPQYADATGSFGWSQQHGVVNFWLAVANWQDVPHDILAKYPELKARLLEVAEEAAVLEMLAALVSIAEHAFDCYLQTQKVRHHYPTWLTCLVGLHRALFVGKRTHRFALLCTDPMPIK
jgi:hypothetical protein